MFYRQSNFKYSSIPESSPVADIRYTICIVHDSFRQICFKEAIFRGISAECLLITSELMPFWNSASVLENPSLLWLCFSFFVTIMQISFKFLALQSYQNQLSAVKYILKLASVLIKSKFIDRKTWIDYLLCYILNQTVNPSEQNALKTW